MPTIIIDNIPYQVKAGSNLLEACLGVGIDLPYFCWHPALGSVGACRQCAVRVFKDEQDNSGRLVMSCMEAIKDGIRISVQDKGAKAFREQVIEWLMTNHPHDCPVCDEGGSCHLQDMTVMTGHDYRRFKYKKRTYVNQYLGPLVHHEMNRCIQCYRCVRYYRDYAGGHDLNVFGAHNHVYFGREKDGILESPFSGNLAEVCPTGVFTDKTLKQHYTRKWDLTSAPSVCQQCSVGCNILAGERYGQLRNVLNRYHSEVNGYFICDRGRYGYEHVNNVNRIRQPIIRNLTVEAVDETTLLTHLQQIINNRNLIGIGSPRASVESNYSLMHLVGKENYYSGISEDATFIERKIVDILENGGIHTPSLKEIENADAVIVLGEDIWNTAPVMALSVRQSVTKTAAREAMTQIATPAWNDAAVRERVQENRGYLANLAITESPIDEWSTHTYHNVPDNIARLAFAIASQLRPELPLPAGMHEADLQLAEKVAGALENAKHVVVISGSGPGSETLARAAYNIARAVQEKGKTAGLAFVLPESNSMGAAMMKAPSFDKALQRIHKENNATVIILENDLYRYNSTTDVDQFLDTCKSIIAIDSLNTLTTGKAHVLVPAATFAESDGTSINYEGRAQHYYQVFMPANSNIKESWKWLWKMKGILAGSANGKEHHPDEILKQIESSYPQFTGISASAAPADFRIYGQLLPREPHRYSGRTAMLANIGVSEPKPLDDGDSPFTFTMEGYQGLPPAPLIPFYWRPGWNSVQALNKYQQEIGGPLRGGDPGIRLFDRNNKVASSWFDDTPEAFAGRTGKWLLLPQYHVFGSAEMSRWSPALDFLTPQPCISISQQDAAQLGVSEGHTLTIETDKERFSLPVAVRSDLVQGVVLAPAGFQSLPSLEWGTWIKIMA